MEEESISGLTEDYTKASTKLICAMVKEHLSSLLDRHTKENGIVEEEMAEEFNQKMEAQLCKEYGRMVVLGEMRDESLFP